VRTNESLPESGRTPVSDFVAGLRWEDVPGAVRERAKVCTLDNLCAALAGTQTKVARIASEYASYAWPGDEATILPRGPRTSALGAAFANGSAANGTDIDDCGVYTWGHPGAQIFPTVLAVGQSAGIDGRRFLAATAVGYEVAFRAARAQHDYSETYRACGSWGSVACAAAAAHLMDLPIDQVEQALGIAEYDAPYLPMMRDIDRPSMVKHGIGLGAVTGIMSAQLAARGFTGVAPLLHSERYVGWADDLGEQWLLPAGIQWKYSSCCAWAHPSLEAVKRLMAQGTIRPEEIERIEVRTYDEAARLTAGVPTSTEAAQFSVAWPVAALLVDGEVGPAQVLEERLADLRLRRVAEKVHVIGDPELTRLHALSEDFDPEGKDAAAVAIHLTGGRVLDSGLVDCPPLEFSRAEIIEKARWLLKPIVRPSTIDDLISLVLDLDQLSHIDELVALIADGIVSGAVGAGSPA
jgi:2-methylcitrate dehydratase PrpD